MTIEKAVETALRAARTTGAEGKPFPLVDGITADMSIDDARLLVHAWTLRQYPAQPASDIDAVDDFVVSLVVQWQKGALMKACSA